MPNARPSAGSLAGLSPANFAIVMATGILGVVAGQQGHDGLAHALLVVNAVAWPVLLVLTLARLVLHSSAFLADVRSHQRAPGFFTTIAATSVLASQLVSLRVGGALSVILAGLASVLWVLLTYGILLTLTIQQDKPVLAEGISGAWLLTVVSTQSLAVVAELIVPGMPSPAQLPLHFAALTLWMCGAMLYVWVIALIFYRYAFFRLAPQDLTPTYWINMGAMAISALAGGLLVLDAPEAPLLQDLLPFVKGGTVLFWAVGTWWIPLLVALGVWRYVHSRYPLRYDTAYWGAVFPLGMYSAATHELATVLGLRFLAPLARGFFYAAAAAWLLAAWGLARHVRSAWAAR